MLSWQVFQKFSRDQQILIIFGIEKRHIDFFFNFFKTNVSDFVLNINDDCFQLSFEVNYIFVAQKLKILENVKHFFLAWTLVTLANSRGPNFDLSNLNRVSNVSWRCQLSYEILFLDKNNNLEALDCVLQSGLGIIRREWWWLVVKKRSYHTYTYVFCGKRLWYPPDNATLTFRVPKTSWDQGLSADVSFISILAMVSWNRLEKNIRKRLFPWFHKNNEIKKAKKL